MKYKNYVFDLYGTLVDIHTDESSPALWRALAGLYAASGADYTPSGLRAAFLREERKARRILGKKLSTAWPEIRLEEVFALLLSASPRTRRVSAPEDLLGADFGAALFKVYVAGGVGLDLPFGNYGLIADCIVAKSTDRTDVESQWLGPGHPIDSSVLLEDITR